MPDVMPPNAQNVGLDPVDLETFNPAYCEKLRTMGEQVAKSGVGLDIYPGLKDKESFEQTIYEALKQYPRAEEWIVRQYQTCLAEGFYGAGKVPFDTSGDSGSCILLPILGVAGAIGGLWYASKKGWL